MLDSEDKQWIGSRVERLETTQLTEFHKFAEANDARVRSHGAMIHSLELQLEALEDRIRKLEQRSR